MLNQLMTRINNDNFKQLGDYSGYKTEFMQLNGFDVAGIDYQADIDLQAVLALTP
jgi:enoyl-[acyl-carrier protein] reductase/trans-2-enoyl-CoA reductase (NAD+)